MHVTLAAKDVGKMFNRRPVLAGISFSLSSGESIGLTGRNGSGKSTLIKILAGVLSPSKGSVGIAMDSNPVSPADVFEHVGLVSPYLQLYDEFSAIENLEFAANVRGFTADRGRLEDLLARVNLLHRGNDLVRTYSSGMKQRLKYSFALLHAPPILLLDEPSSNLDRDGTAIVHTIIRDQKERGITVIATNDQEDLQFCDSTVSVELAAGGKEHA